MTRPPGKRYASDERGWMKVGYDQVLDDPRLQDPDRLGPWLRGQAMLKRMRGRDGRLVLSRRDVLLLAGREQYRHALRIVRSGAADGLWTIESESEDASQIVIRFPNWRKSQGFAPTDPHGSPSGAPPTETQTETQISPTREAWGRSAEEGERSQALGALVAAAAAPFRKGAPRGSMQRDRKASNQDIAESKRILARDLEEQARRRAARGGES